MSTEALWYLARGSGAVSLILLTAVLVLGVANRRGRDFLGLPRLSVAAVHRSAGLLAVVFVVVHVLTLLADPYAQLKLVDLVLPFLGEYRPLWTGLGTLSFDLVLAIVATSLLRARIGLRAWRAVHWAAYALWPIALAHGIGAGSDRSTFWMIGIDVVCVAAVAGALLMHPAVTDESPRGAAPYRSVPHATSRRSGRPMEVRR